MVNERNYGVDLLRIVLMFMVCMLHTLGRGGVLDSCDIGTLQYKIYWFLEVFSYCAVDGFAIISGYVATNKSRKYEKLVDMWFQAFFYSFIVTFIFTIIGVNESWPKSDIIRCALPVTYIKFWYFTAFFALFFAMPIINSFVFSINDYVAKKLLFVVFFLFSIMGLVADSFFVKSGYTTIWLIVLYLIGALSKKVKLFDKKNNITLVIIWICCILFSWLLLIFKGDERLISYVSPTILLSGMIMVILFSRIKLKGNIISKITPLVFGVYLFQLNQVIWNSIIQNAFAFVVNRSILVGLVYIFGFASIIFLSGLVVEFLRSLLFRFLRISSLSKTIVKTIETIMVKLFIFLE